MYILIAMKNRRQFRPNKQVKSKQQSDKVNIGVVKRRKKQIQGRQSAVHCQWLLQARVLRTLQWQALRNASCIDERALLCRRLFFRILGYCLCVQRTALHA